MPRGERYQRGAHDVRAGGSTGYDRWQGNLDRGSSVVRFGRLYRYLVVVPILILLAVMCRPDANSDRGPELRTLYARDVQHSLEATWSNAELKAMCADADGGQEQEVAADFRRGIEAQLPLAEAVEGLRRTCEDAGAR